MERNLIVRIEAVQQHLHVSHVARRLICIGQLLKRDQGSRESLTDDELIAARHRSQTANFWSTHGARPFGILTGTAVKGPFPIAWLGNHNL
jgi:hypothetical protein